jgi:hypothetical protein
MFPSPCSIRPSKYTTVRDMLHLYTHGKTGADDIPAFLVVEQPTKGLGWRKASGAAKPSQDLTLTQQIASTSTSRCNPTANHYVKAQTQHLYDSI